MSIVVRQPLTSGSASLFRWSRLGAALPAIVSLAFAVQCHRQDSPVLMLIGLVTGIILLFPAVAAIFVSAETASDVFIDDAGLRINGGRCHGLTLRWEEISPGGVELVEAREKRMTLSLAISHLFFLVIGAIFDNKAQLAPYDGDPAARLFISTRDGRRLEIAHGIEEDEIISLRALLEGLLGRLAPEGEEEAPSDFVRCSHCNAAAPPDEKEQVPCAFCGHTVIMPDNIRTRMADHLKSAPTEDTQRLLAKLTHLPSARTATLASRAVFISVILLWVAGISILSALIVAGAVDAFILGFLGICTGLLVIASWRFGLLSVVDRTALGALGAQFGARAPAQRGGQWRCRGCGAPLPETRGALLRCAYCDMQSVVGVDSRRRITPVTAQSLEQELTVRSLRRKGAVKQAIVWTGIALFSIFWMIAMAAISIEELATQKACDANDGAACYSISLSYFTGSSREENRDLALEYAEKSCALGNIDGCCTVLSYVEFKWSENVFPKNPDAAAKAVKTATAKDGKNPCED